jgi:hypothetical protein
VTETGDDGIAAAQVLLQLLIAKRQQAGLDNLEVGAGRDAGRELPARSYDDANVDAAIHELLQYTPACASGAANEKNGLLRSHVYVPFKKLGGSKLHQVRYSAMFSTAAKAVRIQFRSHA